MWTAVWLQASLTDDHSDYLFYFRHHVQQFIRTYLQKMSQNIFFYPNYTVSVGIHFRKSTGEIL